MKTTNNTKSEACSGGKKELWLYHPAIGYYQPTTPDPITGVNRIKIIEEWKIKNGALVAIKRGTREINL